MPLPSTYFLKVTEWEYQGLVYRKRKEVTEEKIRRKKKKIQEVD